MKKLLFPLILLSIGLLSSQCKTKKNSNDTKETTENTESKDTADILKTELVDGEFDLDLDSTDPITIKDAKIVGDLLHLEVEHSGGCGPHIFTLYGSKDIMKSLPPIRGLFLHHDLNGDHCRALITHTIVFDITKFAYKKEMGSEIKLKLNGWKKELMYKYVGK